MDTRSETLTGWTLGTSEYNSTPPLLRFVRHAESTWNAAGTIQGQCDTPELTEQGRSQARDVARRLCLRRVRRIYSSDLWRALQTADVIATAAGAPVVVDARLRERSYGSLEGQAIGCATAAVTGISEGMVIGPDVRPPGGETLREVHRRVLDFAEDLLQIDGTREEAIPGDVVVVGHGGSLRMLDAALDGTPVEQMAWPPLENVRVTDRVHTVPVSLGTAGRRAGGGR